MGRPLCLGSRPVRPERAARRMRPVGRPSRAGSRTRRIRLGTLVTAVARRRPCKFAREVASLDALSHGRAVLGRVWGAPAWVARLSNDLDHQWVRPPPHRAFHRARVAGHAAPAPPGRRPYAGKCLQAVREQDKSAHGLHSIGLWAVLARRRALSSQTPTSRCRSATAGRQLRARESTLGAGRAATGTRVALRRRARLPARQHVRP